MSSERMYRIVHMKTGKSRMVTKAIFDNVRQLNDYGFMQQDIEPVKEESQSVGSKEIDRTEIGKIANKLSSYLEEQLTVEQSEEVIDTFNESLKAETEEKPKRPYNKKQK